MKFTEETDSDNIDHSFNLSQLHDFLCNSMYLWMFTSGLNCFDQNRHKKYSWWNILKKTALDKKSSRNLWIQENRKFPLVHPLSTYSVTESDCKKKHLTAIFRPRALMYIPKTWNFTSGGVQNREAENRRLRMISGLLIFAKNRFLHHFLISYKRRSFCTISWRISQLTIKK